jgi:hypothetical protein
VAGRTLSLDCDCRMGTEVGLRDYSDTIGPGDWTIDIHETDGLNLKIHTDYRQWRWVRCSTVC